MKLLRNIVLVSLFLSVVCGSYASADIMMKYKFQKSVLDLVSPYFMDNRKDVTLNGKSFQQAYFEWKEKITSEYEVLRKGKIQKYDALEQYLNEAAKKEKACRAPVVMVTKGSEGVADDDKYWVVDGSYMHRYTLNHTFTNYRCSHNSMEGLKTHVYWIRECNQRCSNLWNMLESGGELISGSDINDDAKLKLVGGKILEPKGNTSSYDHFEFSDFYREKLEELNKMILAYSGKMVEANTITMSLQPTVSVAGTEIPWSY